MGTLFILSLLMIYTSTDTGYSCNKRNDRSANNDIVHPQQRRQFEREEDEVAL